MDLKVNNSIVSGVVNTNTHIISINGAEDDEYFIYVLLHEINHAILYESGFSDTGLPLDLEEIIVDQIAKVMTKCFNIKPKGK